MSNQSLAFKVSSVQKDYLNKVIKKIQKEKGLTKGDSLHFIVDHFDKELYKGAVDKQDFLPPNVMDAIRDIECNFLQFSEDTFYCLEKFAISKKKDILGIEPNEIIAMCTACKQGKADKIRIQMDKERRKESVRKLMDFAKTFMVITEHGFMAQSYMCTCDELEGQLSFSRDGKTLTCPMSEGDIVDIEDICMTRLNPDTDEPPCQYLITLDHLVQLSKEDLETMNLIVPVIKYEEPPVNQEVMNKKEPRKQVDSEIVVNDGVVKHCPDCDTPLSENDKGLYCHKCDYTEEVN